MQKQDLKRSGIIGNLMIAKFMEVLVRLPLVRSGAALLGADGKAATAIRGGADGTMASAEGTSTLAGQDAPAGTPLPLRAWDPSARILGRHGTIRGRTGQTLGPRAGKMKVFSVPDKTIGEYFRAVPRRMAELLKNAAMIVSERTAAGVTGTSRTGRMLRGMAGRISAEAASRRSMGALLDLRAAAGLPKSSMSRPSQVMMLMTSEGLPDRTSGRLKHGEG